jgi:hypothetical protein
MSERLTAEQVLAELEKLNREAQSLYVSADNSCAHGMTAGLTVALRLIREHLVPRYADPAEYMPEGYYWCEELPADSPPQKVVRCNRGVDSEGNEIGGVWRRWTIAGWVDLTGRVCPIGERPE